MKKYSRELQKAFDFRPCKLHERVVKVRCNVVYNLLKKKKKKNIYIYMCVCVDIYIFNSYSSRTRRI